MPTNDKALQRKAGDIRALLEATNKEKPAAADVDALRAALVQDPAIWVVAGDLQQAAYADALRALEATPAVRESVRAGRLALRRELGYETATALERLLIDHAVLCWLRQQLCEYHYTAARLNSGRTLQQARYDEDRMTATQRRYLRALEALARVRRLLYAPGMVQVNVGAQQVNVAGPAAQSGTK